MNFLSIVYGSFHRALLKLKNIESNKEVKLVNKKGRARGELNRVR